MNTFRTPETPLRATYMTQDEANEVMELWSERQREEAARLSLVTVHDVAEAIQVSPEQVDHLLNVSAPLAFQQFHARRHLGQEPLGIGR